MSFTGNVSGPAIAVVTDKDFFCYQCNRNVTVTISPSSDPSCPLCNDGFLEEYENPNPNSGFDFLNPSRIPFDDPYSSLPDPFSALLPLLLSSSSPASADHNSPNIFGSSRSGRDDPFAFDPSTFFQNHLNDLRSSGANIQFVIENNPSEPGFRLPANIGDYFIGPGLEQLIQQLAENDPNRYGTPPASKSAMDALPSVKITKNHLNSEFNQCAVCMDEFEEGTQAMQMPCKHLYHRDCLFPWLESHNSCPVCRHELPTDDPDYERRVRGAPGTVGGSDGGGSGAASGVQSSTGDNRIVERSFRISLPWPFGSRGSGDNPEPREEGLD
ncbi:RNF181 protein [Hibiscus syriacus]|uniref:RING-type E3 ubiquitin transferase n=1 Tax=Hibiscus syriacus TaxID=106335 RepID=A0A6A3ANN6_HIBSY|nr:E3 ubiquitin-protein ligase RING1-like [Hibiscus syriacus]XP_038998556.1 E3 ubiquitin-protein ligase RING1-like [Hibiscus syriacus]KAE8706230.1 RNF181 protein [Hibiscus syriacus]